MRRLILFLLFLVASVWFGLEMMRHPGYLLIVSQPWMVQMPLWFALITAFFTFLLFYFLLDSIDRFQFLCFRFKNWLRFRREQQSFSKTQQGLSCLIEARWKKAERLLLKGANQSSEPLINYLGAAKAAHELGAFDRRHAYIQKAYKIAPKADLAIGLTQAQLELSQDQLEQAEATLNYLRQQYPRHPRVLKLLERVYVRLADWKSLEELLPGMRKAKLINAEQMEHFEKNVYCEMLHDYTCKSIVELNQMWENIPRHIRKNPDVVYAYVKKLVAFSGSSKEMEDVIRRTLKHSWHAGLAQIYSTLPFDNLNRQLVIAGAWLKMYGQQPALLLLLGKLCVRVQLWGKAKDYFERCLSLGPHAEAALEYGKLLEQLGEMDEAMRVYREGLAQLAHEQTKN